jgi:two-component system, NtrC family, sensor kinase
MKKILSTIVLLVLIAQSEAQVKVTFIIKENTTIKHDSIFVTGNFSNWDSTVNPAYLMKPHGENEKSITLNLKSGIIRYKFHRGSWLNVEKQFMGDEVPDRVINIRKDTVLSDEVNAWRDELIADKWKTLSLQIPDTTRMKLLTSLVNLYAFLSEYINTDSAFYYTQQALQLAQTMKSSNNKADESRNTAAFIQLQEITATLLHSLGNYPKSLEIRLENLKLVEKEKDKFLLAWALGAITKDYLSMKDYQSMLHYAKQQDSVLSTLDKKDQRMQESSFWAKYNIASAYYRLNKLSTALAYAKQALSNNSIDSFYFSASQFRDFNGRQLIGDIYSAMGESDSAMKNYRFNIANVPEWLGNNIAIAQTGMAKEFKKAGRIDSALFYGRKALTYYQNNELSVREWGENSLYYIAELTPLLAELYKSNNQPDSAYKYLKLSVAIKDSLYNTDKLRQFQTLSFNEANRLKQLEQQSKEERQRYETKIKMYGLITIITGFVVLAFVLYRNNRQKQKANNLLQSQMQKIETTLTELKNTQKQLIQSEKMASLGELTAGIAHEIQNPLNFVNNFSEVSKELIEEVKSERSKVKSQRDDAIEEELLNNIAQNLDKINHHGKRADAIVKSMLQHSRSSTGQKEPSDINALCDEYLRLAYHGLKAKDKDFHATFEFYPDQGMPKVEVVPQDIGRVLLNLINNAFYAVSEKSKTAGTGYQPKVTVGTARIDGKVEITVSDNGNGIPEAIRDKIFQPFFTTKPTGQGTGLGLSLSYDIVTKGHGGELKLESAENAGTTFIISLPSLPSTFQN